MVRVQQESTRQNHRFSLIRPAFPAQWFYGLYVVSPVRPGFFVTVIGAMQSIIAKSAPASGRQDHTISPYASAALVSRSARVHRISPQRS
jgi:hypothetical protein